MAIDFYVEIGKKEKKKFDSMDINGHALPCRSRKKGIEKVCLHSYRHEHQCISCRYRKTSKKKSGIRK